MVDAEGLVVPTASDELVFSVNGCANLLAVGNANVKDEDPYSDNRHHVWQGRALAIIRNNGKPGKATLSVTAKELPTSRITLQAGK